MKGVSSQLSKSGSPAILLVKDSKTLETLPIVQATSEHRNFILSTWVRSYESQARSQGIGPQYAKHEPAIAESRWGDCLVVTDDGGFTVHAWVCAGEGALFHVYVVPELRKLRIATRLIEFASGGLKEYARPWPYAAHAKVNPYLLRAKEQPLK